jgi:cytochrome c oxidase cbb3-type subunit 3
MYSRYRIEYAGLVSSGLATVLLGGCARGPAQPGLPMYQLANQGVITSALVPGLTRSAATNDPRAAEYYNNADAVGMGKRVFQQYNCSGCHSNGGGGMGPDLMDNQWIYGGRLEQIHQTLVEGRPNGMPAWGGKIPDEQLWDLAAYVRSLSLPETLAADHGDTPSQSPAPVPPSADHHAGWSPPPDTTNDYTDLVTGPQ